MFRWYRRLWAAALAVVAISTFTAPLKACLWDYDTLQMERQRFPSAFELITGKFTRHSEEYYRWRLEDRTAKLSASQESLPLLDDIAVAHDKLGQHQTAIDTMLRSLEIDSERYETLANLGTFYIHNGEFEKGLDYIDRALRINPDAHFGRERYQKYLVEYVQSRRENEERQLPLRDDPAQPIFGPVGFASFVLESEFPKQTANGNPTEVQRRGAIKSAVKGVLGMMRFGHHDSPVLLEAVGDLLLADIDQDAKQLAARAYLKAEMESPSDEAKAAYRTMATHALRMQTVAPGVIKEMSLKSLQRQLQEELVNAEQWNASVRADELRWIKSGVDVDAEFAKKYYKATEGVEEEASQGHDMSVRTILAILAAMMIAVGLGAVAFAGLRLRRRVSDTSEFREGLPQL